MRNDILALMVGDGWTDEVLEILWRWLIFFQIILGNPLLIDLSWMVLIFFSLSIRDNNSLATLFLLSKIDEEVI